MNELKKMFFLAKILLTSKKQKKIMKIKEQIFGHSSDKNRVLCLVITYKTCLA